MKRLVCGVAVLSLLSALTEQASAQYTFTTLESINPSAQLAAPLAINNRGQIVGFDLNTATGFLLNGTNFSLVGPPGAILSQAWGINDSGDIVGGLVIPPARTFGFLYSGGNYTPVNVPGGTESFPRGINNAGDIVGEYGPSTQSQGFLLHAGSYTTFSVPNAVLTIPYKINDLGQIVGVYGSLGNYHSFLLSGGVYTTLEVPGSTETIARGINNSGELVGYYTVGDTRHGFLFSDGTYTTIDVPGAIVTGLSDINDAGQIVGGYLDAASNDYGFVATPTPEPSTLVLLGIASVAGIIVARRGKLRSASQHRTTRGFAAAIR